MKIATVISFVSTSIASLVVLFEALNITPKVKYWNHDFQSYTKISELSQSLIRHSDTSIYTAAAFILCSVFGLVLVFIPRFSSLQAKTTLLNIGATLALLAIILASLNTFALLESFVHIGHSVEPSLN